MQNSKIVEKTSHYTTITVLFVAVLLISNIASTKIVDFGWLTFDAGTLLFPLSYIFGDILTEVYGYKKAKQAIWLGFASALVMSVTIMLVGALPAAADWPHQEAYDAVLGFTPRIVLASLIAYMAGEFSNSRLMVALKQKTNGKHLWMRTIGSTVVGQGLDTVIFIGIAFAGVMPASVLVTLIVSNYIFKVGIEVVCTPITYRVIGYLSSVENRQA